LINVERQAVSSKLTTSPLSFVSFQEYNIMKKYVYILTIVLSVVGFGVPSASAQGGFSVGAKVGTTGLGAEAAYGLTKRVNVRGGIALYDFTVSYTTEGNDPDVKFDLDSDNQAINVFIDYLPFKRFLRLTGGLVYQGPSFKGVGTPVENYTDPQTGFSIPPDQMGSIELELAFEEKVSPYLGFGFGNSVYKNRLTLSFDAGIIFSGKPTVTSRTYGRMAEVLDYDPQEIQNETDKIEVWPLISFGLALRLF
jgi:hypothetical protein